MRVRVGDRRESSPISLAHSHPRPLSYNFPTSLQSRDPSQPFAQHPAGLWQRRTQTAKNISKPFAPLSDAHLMQY